MRTSRRSSKSPLTNQRVTFRTPDPSVDSTALAPQRKWRVFQMTILENLSDLRFNRGFVTDPIAFAKDTNAVSWLFLCGEEFAAMEEGISYADVQAAVDKSVNIVSDPPRVLDMDLAKRHVAALDELPRP